MANFLDLLKGEGQAVQVIQSLFNQGTPGSQILQQLRDMNLGIRTQTFYQVLNYISGTVAPANDYIKYINLNSYPTISRLPLSLTKQLRNFAYNVTITGFDRNTGNLVDRTISVSSNSLLTKQQAIDAAVDIASSPSSTYGVTGASGTVNSITQNSAGLVDPSPYSS